MQTHDGEDAANGPGDKGDGQRGNIDLSLAERVAARICHDLASPLGALGNGIELLDMAAASPGSPIRAELDLLTQSIDSAQAQMRLLRLAFGPAQDDQPLPGGEAVQFHSAVAKTSRYSIDWAGAADLTRADARLLALLCLCLQSALPWGGQVRVLRDAGDLRVIAQSTRLRWDDALWSMLTGTAPASLTAPRDIHFPLTARALAQADRRVHILHDDVSLAIRVLPLGQIGE